MKKLSTILAFVLVCSLLVIGCKSSPTATTSPTSQAPAAPTTTAKPASPAPTTAATAAPTTTAAAGQQKYGGTVRVVTAIDPGNWGWPPSSAGTTPGVQNYCYECLADMDFQGNITPKLATSWTIAPDNKSITFSLRQGVKFHDGTDFNAAAVKFNLDAQIAAKRLPNIQSVDVIDNYTVRVNLNQFTNTTWYSFYGITGYMVSPTAVNTNGIDYIRTHMVGTGPFIQSSYQKDVTFKAVKNQNYWQKGKPYLDSVQIVWTPDLSTQVALMKSGDGDVWDATAGKDASVLENLGFVVRSSALGTATLEPDTMNADSVFASQTVRQAIEYAIDKEAIAKAFSYGYWTAAYELPLTTSPAYDTSIAVRKYDPAKAKQMLKDAGYPNGFSCTIISGTQPGVSDMCTAIQDQLSKVNIKATVETPQQAKYIDYRDVSGWKNALFAFNTPYYANFNQFFNEYFLTPTQLKSMKRSDTLLQLAKAAVAPPTFDATLTRKVIQQAYDENMMIPFGYTARCWIYPNYVRDAGYFETGLQFIGRPENIWLNK